MGILNSNLYYLYSIDCLLISSANQNVMRMFCFSGPLLALGLAREDAVKGWRDMLGPAEVEVAKEQAPDR